MKKLTVKTNGAILFSALFYFEQGMRGQIEVYTYDTSGNLKEKNSWGDFFVSEGGALHLNRTYQFFENATYIMAFTELQRVLYQLALEEDQLINENGGHARNFINSVQIPGVELQVRDLSNIESLAYLFNHAIHYNCSPALTNDILDKLEFTAGEDDYERSALIIRDEIASVIHDNGITEETKRAQIERIISDNVELFTDHERAQKKK